jgi:hypothetical protein
MRYARYSIPLVQYNTCSSRSGDECESTKSVVGDIIVMINRTSGVCTGLTIMEGGGGYN